MAATQLIKLSSTGAADNTAITAANMGASSVSMGTGNTAVISAAAAMGDLVGFSLTQVTNTMAAFLDFSAAAIVAPRVPCKLANLPSSADPGAAVIRGYSDGATHTATLWTVYVTNTGKLRMVEATSTPSAAVTVTSTASLSANTEYIIIPVINSTTKDFTVVAYAWSNPAASVTLSGTFANSLASTNSVRIGIGNTSTGIGTIFFNDSVAVFGLAAMTDVVPRVDLAVMTVSPAAGQGSYTTTVTLSGFGSGGTKSGTLDWGDGSGVSASTSPPTWSKVLTPPTSGGPTVYNLTAVMSSTAP
jgi:hypothetical protein